MKKAFLSFSCILMLLLVFSSTVLAAVNYPVDTPYETYIYNSENEPIAIPSAFSTKQTFSGTDITETNFSRLSDVFYNGSGKIVLCDSDNSRIVITDTSLQLIAEVTQFDYQGRRESLNHPKGVWADDSSVYVADTDNHRIVSFHINGETVTADRIFERPDISVLSEDYEYTPTKLSVDAAGKMYVIAEGVNQGLICLNEKGDFQSFLGAPQVEPNFFEAVWRKIATKEQLARMESYVPTEYSSITMDTYGFLYVTSQTSNSVPAGKINSNGDNVITKIRNGDFGDLEYLGKSDTSYAPYFTDVALCSSGKIGEDIYYLIDSRQGRIYGYTDDGYLLYAFGMNGSQHGTFYSASAIEYIPGDNTGDVGRLLIADSFKNTLTVLQETDFAVRIRNALSLYNLGKYEEARSAWTEVQNISSGYMLANIGIAKLDLIEKQYRTAMAHLKDIREYELYAQAFSSWRDDFIRGNFSWLIVAVLAAVVIVGAAVYFYKKSGLCKKLAGFPVCRGYKYGTYVMFHPFDGFWDVKREKRGNLKSAIVIAVLFFVFYALNLQFGGYIVTKTISEEVNVLYHVALMFLPLLLWVISNWCFTTLMDGKGSMRDIIIATCYALKPYVIFALPMLVLSNVLAVSEIPFYMVLQAIVVGWVIFLLFSGLMMTHDYSLGKSVLTVILILVGICLIIFIMLLILSIAQDLYQFVYNIYQELSFRSY